MAFECFRHESYVGVQAVQSMVAVQALGALNEVLAALCAAARCTGSRSASWAEWDSDIQ